VFRLALERYRSQQRACLDLFRFPHFGSTAGPALEIFSDRTRAKLCVTLRGGERFFHPPAVEASENILFPMPFRIPPHIQENVRIEYGY
jgi:hypothetical protein